MNFNQFNSAAALFRISRPVNVAIGMASIFIAVFITGTIQPLEKVLLAVFSGGLITAAANTVNDYFDLEIDRVNKPWRPLPAGDLTPRQALIFSVAEFIAGVVCALFIHWVAFSIAAVFSLLLFFYSCRLKRLPVWGNLTVSLASAMAFVYGGVAVGRIRQTLVPAVLAFFYHFGREVVKDVQDMAGDARDGARTFPLVYGRRAALLLTTFNFVLLMALIALPYAWRWYGRGYFWTILLAVYPVLIFSMISIWRDSGSRNLGFISNLLKADMLAGLLAIYLG